MTDSNKKTLMQFPCDFPLKIIGKNSELFASDILKIINKYFSNILLDNFSINISQNHKYASITVILHVTNQETLDALYIDLTNHPDTNMVL